jgi:antitoxin component YwqK of YwqJK toxin-antitoxin module
MAKTFIEEYGLTYTEFFAYYNTTGGDLNNLRDSDDCSRLLQEYNASNPPDGWFRRYWENGNLRYEWYFKDGKQDGVSKAWWPNGDIKSERNYKDGKQDGLRTSWYENGQVAGISDYKDGKDDGLWTDYYKSGQVWMKKTYESGNLISEEYWNADGSVGGKNCHRKGEFKFFRKINPDYLK